MSKPVRLSELLSTWCYECGMVHENPGNAFEHESGVHAVTYHGGVCPSALGTAYRRMNTERGSRDTIPVQFAQKPGPAANDTELGEMLALRSPLPPRIV